MDLRDDRQTLELLAYKNIAPVTTRDGEKVAKSIGATRYLECSALTQRGMKNVFDEIVKSLLLQKKLFSMANKKKRCTIF